MKPKVAYSVEESTSAAVAAIAATLRPTDPTLVVFFSSPRHAPAELARAMARAFPNAATLGCTTAGEIVSGRMLEHAVVALALGAGELRSVHLAPMHGLAGDGRSAVRSAFATLSAAVGQPLRGLDHTKYVGLVLLDGLSRAEERVLDEIGNMTDVRFVGGSAGDDLRFSATHVMCNGEALADAGVVALLEVAGAFEIIKTQSFRVLPRKLVATKVDEANRLVCEFNGQPAVAAYAAAVGTSPDKAHEFFMRHPVGLLVDGEPYVRSPQRVVDGAIAFYCSIVQGMELALLESGDIVADTAQALARTRQVRALLNFNCILRTLDLRNQGKCEAYGNVFADVPTAGFSTYGEAYLGHINQTSTMLAFLE